MTIQQMLLGTGLPLVLPLTDVDIFHDAVGPPGFPPPNAEASYAITSAGVAERRGVGIVTPAVLPETWLPEGATYSDYRVRYTLLSRSPTNTVVTTASSVTLGTWFTPNTSVLSYVSVASDDNSIVGQLYEAVIRADIALASNLSNILTSAEITLRIRRTSS